MDPVTKIILAFASYKLGNFGVAIRTCLKSLPTYKLTQAVVENSCMHLYHVYMYVCVCVCYKYKPVVS